MKIDQYLKPTFFIDSDAKSVKEQARELTKGVKGEKEKAKKIFYFVRDEIKYNPLSPRSSPDTFRASYVLSAREGYCVQKAVFLVALARAAGIPSRLRFAEIRNHLVPQKLLKMRGTNVFPYHGYTDLYLTGTWIKATPIYDLRACQKAGLIPVDFDGEHDAMLHPYARDGRLHIKYITDRGYYKDLPFHEIREASILARKLQR